MIIDSLSRRAYYANLSPRLNVALEHLANTDFSNAPLGRYDIDGDNIFVIVNDYLTQPKETQPFESHQAYIDVQFVVSGQEEVGYVPLTNQPTSKPYDEQRDFSNYDFVSLSATASFIPLTTGMFAVFFPEDIHMPGVSAHASPVRKVVIKIKV